MVFEGIGMDILYLVIVVVVVVAVAVIFYLRKPKDWEEEEEEELLREILAKGTSSSKLQKILKRSSVIAKSASFSKRRTKAEQRMSDNTEKILQEELRTREIRADREALTTQEQISEAEQRLVGFRAQLSTLNNQIGTVAGELNQKQTELGQRREELTGIEDELLLIQREREYLQAEIDADQQ